MANLSRDTGRDIPWSTNAHGMRDREYPEAKPPGTFRIALVWKLDEQITRFLSRE